MCEYCKILVIRYFEGCTLLNIMLLRLETNNKFTSNFILVKTLIKNNDLCSRMPQNYNLSCIFSTLLKTENKPFSSRFS